MTARLATEADRAAISSIIMHPEVWAKAAHDGAPPFDPSIFLDASPSFAVMVEGGCFLAAALEARAYQIHTNFLPEARGRNALLESMRALALAFLTTDAEQLVTMVPGNNKPAERFAHMMGFRDTYLRERAWPAGGERHDLQYMTLGIDDWVLRAPGLSAIGQRFHELLGEDVNHEHDAVHDRYVGTAAAMIEHGQVDKAVRVYGRWARYAGYFPFAIASRDPLRIDIHSAVLRVQDGGFIVEKD